MDRHTWIDGGVSTQACVCVPTTRVVNSSPKSANCGTHTRTNTRTNTHSLYFYLSGHRPSTPSEIEMTRNALHQAGQKNNNVFSIGSSSTTPPRDGGTPFALSPSSTGSVSFGSASPSSPTPTFVFGAATPGTVGGGGRILRILRILRIQILRIL